MSSSGTTTIDLISTAKIRDWQEVTTDAEGEVFTAYDQNRRLTDRQLTDGSFSESYDYGGYVESQSAIYDMDLSSHVTETKVGDDTYEYFYKDQKTSMEVNSTVGYDTMEMRSSTRKTLEYEILEKDTQTPTYLEYIEQTLSRFYYDGAWYSDSYDSDNGRSKALDANGVILLNPAPSTSPNAVGNGATTGTPTNPSSDPNGPFATPPGGGDEEPGFSGLAMMSSGGGGEGGEGEGEGGEAVGNPVTDIISWAYHNPDLAIGKIDEGPK